MPSFSGLCFDFVEDPAYCSMLKLRLNRSVAVFVTVSYLNYGLASDT
jgi:hypothetical protein